MHEPVQECLLHCCGSKSDVAVCAEVRELHSHVKKTALLKQGQPAAPPSQLCGRNSHPHYASALSYMYVRWH